LLARQQTTLDEAKEAIQAQYPDALIHCYSIDVNDYDKLASLVEQIVVDFGSIDVLINSAGILFEGYFEETPLDIFEKINATNYLALVAMTKHCLPYLKRSRGHIVNI